MKQLLNGSIFSFSLSAAFFLSSLGVANNIDAVPYQFKKIECGGRYQGPAPLSKDFRFIALHINYNPQTTTDILGQTKKRYTRWTYSLGASVLEAKTDLKKESYSAFLSGKLFETQLDGETWVFKPNNHLKLRLTSTSPNTDNFEGAFTNHDPDDYWVTCVATK